VQAIPQERATGAEHYAITASGRRVSLLNPSPGDIQIRDIAAALARICWTPGMIGAGFYSAAQHAVEVRREAGDGFEAIYGLLSNARCAYLGRIPSPFMLAAPAAGPLGLGEVERRFDEAILEAVGLATPNDQARAKIETARSRIEATELRDLSGGLPGDYAGPRPLGRRLSALVGTQPPARAFSKTEDIFLREFWALVTHLNLKPHRAMMR
jgi:hypothetical protein